MADRMRTDAKALVVPGNADLPYSDPVPAPAPAAAGREMDAAIAEKVFGWRWHTFEDDEPTPFTYLIYDGNWPMPSIHARRRDGVLDSYYGPAYSSDIAAAWTIIDALMSEAFFMFSVNCSHESGWWCVAYPPSGPSIDAEYAATAPLAICECALRAIAAFPAAAVRPPIADEERE